MRTFIGVVNGMTDASAEYEDDKVPALLSKVAEDMASEFGMDGINTVRLCEDTPESVMYHFKVARSTTVHAAVVEEN